MRVGCPEEDQLVVSISDVEMGCGGMFDDFPHTAFLADLIRTYAGPEHEHLDVHLVFNGDTFDFLKMPVEGVYPTLITERVALQKLQQVMDSHPDFFAGLRDFLQAKSGRGHVHFVVGNHDLELLFPAVQEGIAARIGCDGVYFPGLSVAFGDLVVEHGSQGDSLFRVDPDKPFIETSEGAALALPWGAIALLEVAMPMQEQMYALDRLKPRERVFELLPEVRERIVAAFRQYWMDSARTWLGPDPLHRLSWAMLKEVAYRFRTQRADLDATGLYRDRLRADDAPACITIGHTHSAQWWSHADRKLLVSGCFRDEFAVDSDGVVTTLMPKVYVEAFLAEGRVVRSHLVEIQGPPVPDGAMLRSVFDVLAGL